MAVRQALDAETLHSLLASGEQGVLRTTVELLADLHPVRPPDPALLEHVVAMANASDDVGIPRRLIPVLLAMDLPRGIEALALLDMDDTGSKRRLAAILEAHEDAIARGGLQTAVASLLEKCLSQSSEADWKTRCRAYLARLGSTPALPDPEY
ncbi:hypothetical protein [Streptomyces sp. NPDC003717]|uniref:hypothetical protein n=1 Tax=Streptomyces sp. NPDC003717 TaxID=3154276 RepID=UPI0033A51DC9